MVEQNNHMLQSWILKGNNKINNPVCFLAAFYSILCLSNSFHLTGLLICMSENEKASCVTGESAAFWVRYRKALFFPPIIMLFYNLSIFPYCKVICIYQTAEHRKSYFFSGIKFLIVLMMAKGSYHLVRWININWSSIYEIMSRSL